MRNTVSMSSVWRVIEEYCFTLVLCVKAVEFIFLLISVYSLLLILVKMKAKESFPFYGSVAFLF